MCIRDSRTPPKKRLRRTRRPSSLQDSASARKQPRTWGAPSKPFKGRPARWQHLKALPTAN
eukprot:10329773-Alexandrium_andersonii.AAC.1